MIPEAVATVVAAVKAVGLDRGDREPVTVTGFMPLPGDIDRPSAVAVYFDGLDDVNFGVTVAIMVDTSSDIPAAETQCQTLTPAIDEALNTCPAPRSTWARSWSPEYNAYIIQTTLAYPREDF
jgi:hypothetical protein